MRTSLDFPYRSPFDRLFSMIEDAGLSAVDTGPAYDILRSGEDTVSISMAVPGFSQDNLEITTQPNLLIVSGKGPASDDANYLRRGINMRPFVRRFALADHVEVQKADLANGVLTIELKRELPEEMKPRRIAIGGMAEGQVEPEQRQIEGQKSAA
jgi:molecular chaperone IbpA